jgi:hypothetical protein
VLAERDADVPEHEHEDVVGHDVHQAAQPVVHVVDVLAVGVAQLADVVAAELQLHEPVVHRADALLVDLARLDVDRRRLGGVHGVERVDREEVGVAPLQLAQLGDAGAEGALGGRRLALDGGDLGLQPARAGRPGRRAGRPLHLRKARPADDRVVGDVGGVHAAQPRGLGQHRLPVPDRVPAGDVRHPVGAPPGPEGV